MVPRQLTMRTLDILQGEGCGKLLQNQRPLLHPFENGPARVPQRLSHLRAEGFSEEFFQLVQEIVEEGNRRNPGQENDVSQGPGEDVERQLAVLSFEWMVEGKYVNKKPLII